MDVYEAVRSRHSARAFTDRPVPKEALCRVLSAAAWAPSGSNIQPWHVYVLTGAPLTELKRLAGERVAAGDPWDEREYEMYPAALTSPYRERKSAFGAQRYGALGIARGDLDQQSFAVTAQPVRSPRRDEIGELSALHDSMIRELQETGGAVARITTDLAIFEAKSRPPQSTRARLRGEFIRRAQERRRDFTVDWVHLKLNDQAQRTVLCKDPFRSRDERVERLIESM